MAGDTVEDIEYRALTCQCLLFFYYLVIVGALVSHCAVSRVQFVCELSASSALSSPLGSHGDRPIHCCLACEHLTTRSSYTR